MESTENGTKTAFIVLGAGCGLMTMCGLVGAMLWVVQTDSAVSESTQSVSAPVVPFESQGTGAETSGTGSGTSLDGGKVRPVAGVSGGSDQAPGQITDCSGSLSRGDGTLESGEYHDSCFFNAEQGQQIAIDMTSTAFDTYIILVSPSGEQYENDDWLGSTSQSRVEILAPEGGQWRILPTSYEAAETGDYRATIQVGGLIEGRWVGTYAFGALEAPGNWRSLGAAGGPRAAGDVYGADCAGWVAEEPDHVLTVAQASDLTLSVDSPVGLDTTLVLTGPSGTFCNDDRADQVMHPQITTPVEPGTWHIFVGTYSEDADPGPYQITSEATPR